MAVHRSKKSKAASNPNADNGGGSDEDYDTTLKGQLDRALAALLANQEQTSRIHSSWRTQLRLISLVVLFIVVSQMQEPASSCLREIKLWNEEILLLSNTSSNNKDVIGFFRAVRYTASDSVMELLSVMCGLSLVWLLGLRSVKDDFSSLPFRVSCAFIPFVLWAYYQNKSTGCLNGVESSLSPRALDEDIPAAETTDGGQRRKFPVILLFHLISSLSLFSMQSQRKQQESSVERIQQLKKDLLETKKKK
jgi:hypothetical protein